MTGLVLGDGLERGAYGRVRRSRELLGGLDRGDRLAHAALDGGAGGDRGEVGGDRELTPDGERSGGDGLAAVGARQSERELGVPHLVERRAVRRLHQLRRRAGREQLEREARERRHRGVLEERGPRPLLRERSAHRGREAGDGGGGAGRPAAALVATGRGGAGGRVDDEGAADAAVLGLDEVAAALAAAERALEDAAHPAAIGAVGREVADRLPGRRAGDVGHPREAALLRLAADSARARGHGADRAHAEAARRRDRRHDGARAGRGAAGRGGGAPAPRPAPRAS